MAFSRQHGWSRSCWRPLRRSCWGSWGRLGKQDQTCFQTKQVSVRSTTSTCLIVLLYRYGTNQYQSFSKPKKSFGSYLFGSSKKPYGYKVGKSFKIENNTTIRRLATGPAGAPTLRGEWASGSRKSLACRRKCLVLVLGRASLVAPHLGWLAPWRATRSITNTRLGFPQLPGPVGFHQNVISPCSRSSRGGCT